MWLPVAYLSVWKIRFLSVRTFPFYSKKCTSNTGNSVEENDRRAVLTTTTTRTENVYLRVCFRSPHGGVRGTCKTFGLKYKTVIFTCNVYRSCRRSEKPVWFPSKTSSVAASSNSSDDVWYAIVQYCYET